MKILVSFFALFLVVIAAFSQTADTSTPQVLDIDSERSRIQAERAREDLLAEKKEVGCYARFAVTDCLRQVRVSRREALDKLRRQDVLLNDAERKRKAQEQIKQIQEKSSAQRLEEEDVRRLEARKAQQEREQRAIEKATSSTKPNSAQAESKGNKKTTEPSRSANEMAEEQKQYNEKLRQAQEHRASREKINNEKSGTSSKPLPEAP